MYNLIAQAMKVELKIFVVLALLIVTGTKSIAQEISWVAPKYSNSLNFSSIDFDILKINKIKTAQKEATIPISATKLSPSNRLLKSNIVMLKTISAIARKSNT